MRPREMDRLIRHFDNYFEQSDCLVMHPSKANPHIDALLYPPNAAHPYWKLVSMGASDHAMPALPNTLGNRNEYLMLIDPEEDMRDPAVAGWYYTRLMEIALYPFATGTAVTYGHSMEWPPEEGEEMIGAFLEMPQFTRDAGALRCKLGWLKTTVCLQVILLTRSDMDRLLQIGPQAFSDYLYPEEGRAHILCERHRSEKF